jgi:hypothetical protein
MDKATCPPKGLWTPGITTLTVFTVEPLEAFDPDSYIYSMEAVNEFILVLSKFCGSGCCSMFAAML